MCGLCGIFGESAHWSTRLESNGQSSDPSQRRLLRQRRIAAINRMLAASHIRVSDWQGCQYQITSATGQILLAETLSHLWQAVASIRPFDPLRLPPS